MRQIKCPDCKKHVLKHGVLKSGSQRWFANIVRWHLPLKLINLSKELSLILELVIQHQYSS